MQIIKYTPVNERKVNEALKNGDKAITFEAQESISINNKNTIVRNVYIKRFLDCDKDTKDNIVREAMAMGQMKSLTPYIPSFITLIEDKNSIDLVMEKIDGVELEKIIESDDLNIDYKIRLFVKIARVIEPLHKQGKMHRDLKPANIIIHTNKKDKYNDNRDLQPYLIDFGSALLLERYYIGTAKYKAPELDSKKHENDITIKSDIYSLGIILYRLLTKTPIDNIFARRFDKIVIDNYDQSKLDKINSLIISMVDQDPKNRPDIGMVIGKLEDITRKWKK